MFSYRSKLFHIEIKLNIYNYNYTITAKLENKLLKMLIYLDTTIL